MANKKISELPAAGALTGAELAEAVQGGVNVQTTLTAIAALGGGGGGHVIEDEGTPLPQRTKLNFVGSGVTVTDDSGDNATVVTITGGGGGGAVDSVNGQTGVVSIDLQSVTDEGNVTNNAIQVSGLANFDTATSTALYNYGSSGEYVGGIGIVYEGDLK